MTQDALNSGQNASVRIAFGIDEAARMIGVGRTFLYAAIAKNELKTAKVGGRRLVTAQAIHAWLDAHAS